MAMEGLDHGGAGRGSNESIPPHTDLRTDRRRRLAAEADNHLTSPTAGMKTVMGVSAD